MNSVGVVASAVVAAIVALVAAALFIGALTERVEGLQVELEELGDRPLPDLMVPRTPGHEITFSNGGPWGRWSDPQFCPPGHYVCGLRQRVELPIDGDDTAMNAVAFYCCPLDPSDKPSQ